MGTSPDVEENERPEMQYRESIAIDGPVCSLWHIIVHQAQEWRGEKESHCIMPIPPLNESILDTGKNYVTFEETDWQTYRIYNIQERYRDNCRYVKPDRNVHMFFIAP